MWRLKGKERKGDQLASPEKPLLTIESRIAEEHGVRLKKIGQCASRRDFGKRCQSREWRGGGSAQKKHLEKPNTGGDLDGVRFLQGGEERRGNRGLILQYAGGKRPLCLRNYSRKERR